MALTKVDFTTLMRKAVKGTLNDVENKILRKELCARFKNNTYESYLERILIAGYALYSDSAKRNNYVQLAVKLWRKKKLD